jgi:hypothetical protein
MARIALDAGVMVRWHAVALLCAGAEEVRVR